MSSSLEASGSRWCIVVANDSGPDFAMGPLKERAPVQFCQLGDSATPWQKALHRAATIAPVSQIMITASEEDRSLWEPALWFIRPEQRYVCSSHAAAPMSLAAAILKVAARNPAHVITILPARCAVAHEEILRRALRQALRELPSVCEGAIALGVLDMEDSLDEDYLVVKPSPLGRGFAVDGFARRPLPWITQHLRHKGALVSSGIMVGYAGTFAAHIEASWPKTSVSLTERAHAACTSGRECRIDAPAVNPPVRCTLPVLRWHPMAFPQRVFGVYRSGWSGLRTPRAVARVTDFHFHCQADLCVSTTAISYSVRPSGSGHRPA